jgi:hypothetical protein
MITRTILLSAVLLAACGGSKPSSSSSSSQAKAGAPAACGAPTFSCVMPGMGCLEGGADLKAAMGAECASGGGASADAPCTRTGMLGGCLSSSGLTPTQNWCGTLWMSASEKMKTAEDAQAECAKFGTFVAAP